jgi:hypothetical protein
MLHLPKNWTLERVRLRALREPETQKPEILREKRGASVSALQ